MSGIVPVKVLGPVTKDDLLTTSSVPGHAMACKDPRLRLGAVLGKALEAHAGAGPGTLQAILGLS